MLPLLQGKSVYERESVAQEERKDAPGLDPPWTDKAKRGSAAPGQKEKSRSSFRPQSEWGEDPMAARLKQMSEWGEPPSAAKGQRDKSKRESKAPKQKQASEWGEPPSAAKDQRDKSKSEPKAPKQKQASEWGEPPSAAMGQRDEFKSEPKAPKQKQTSEWGEPPSAAKTMSRSSYRSMSEADDYGAPHGTVGANDGDDDDLGVGIGGGGGGGGGAGGAVWRKGDAVLSLLALEEPAEPMLMYTPSGVKALAPLKLGGFDPSTGLPRTAWGQPVEAKLAAELRKQQGLMAKRFAEHKRLRLERRAYLEGTSDLKPATAKALLAEVARLEAKDGGFVLDPRIMFASPREGSGVADPFLMADRSGTRGALALLHGLFSTIDGLGRPTSGAQAVGGARPAPLSPATVKVLFSAHKAQAQKFLDFYGPRLADLRRRDPADYFRGLAPKHAGKFGYFTPEGLPLTFADGTELDRAAKEAAAAEVARAAAGWEARAVRLSLDLNDVATLYNQSSARLTPGKGAATGAQLSSVLTAYAANLGRSSTEQALQLAEAKATASHGGSGGGGAGDDGWSGSGSGGSGGDADASPVKRAAKLVRKVSLRLSGKREPLRPPERLLFLLSGAKAGLELSNDAANGGRCTVSRVLEGSAASGQGVLPGDVLLQINELDAELLTKKAASQALAAALRESHHAGTAVAVVALRYPKAAGDGEDEPPPKSLGAWCWEEVVPGRDKVHAFLESDPWSVVVVALVLVGTVTAPFSEDNPSLATLGLAISLFFLAEISARVYLWRFVKGEAWSFAVLDARSGETAGQPWYRRLQVMNLLDVTVVFVDMVFILATAVAGSAGDSGVAVARLARLGRAARYFRLARNLRALRVVVLFQHNAHHIYHALLMPRFLALVSAFVVADAVVYANWGGGGANHPSTPFWCLVFAAGVSLFCALDLLLRVACHFTVLGELLTFVADPYNFLDLGALVTDLIAWAVFAASDVRGGAGLVKLVRVFRFIRSLEVYKAWMRALTWGRSKPALRCFLECCCPMRLTPEQRSDLKLYGVFFEDGADEVDVEIGKVNEKRAVRAVAAHDPADVAAAWRLVRYDPSVHGEGGAVTELGLKQLLGSKARETCALGEDAVIGAARGVERSAGDEFLFNAITGAVTWDLSHHEHLRAAGNRKAKARRDESDWRNSVKEARLMGREDEAGGQLRKKSALGDGQWPGTFGGRLPFKHAGRYEIVHRGYRAAGDGYGHTKGDCFCGQGDHSRTFVVYDMTGPLRHAVAKVSRRGAAHVEALRFEAGILASIAAHAPGAAAAAAVPGFAGDARAEAFFVKVLDSFDFGAGALRHALVFEEHGPSLGYVLSQLAREPAVDPLYGRHGLDGPDAELLASTLTAAEAEVVALRGGKGKAQPTGYLARAPTRTRVGPIPRPPLPVAFTVDVTRQLLDACDFLHGLGLVHGDITPDNVVFVDPPSRSGRDHGGEHLPISLNTVRSVCPWNATVPEGFSLPRSTRVKLVDLGAAAFIPVAMPLTAGGLPVGLAVDDDDAAAARANAAALAAVRDRDFAAGRVPAVASGLFASGGDGGDDDASSQYSAASSAASPRGGDATNGLRSPIVASSEWLARRAAVPDELPRASLNYRPPEMDVLDPAWGAGVDLWAVGCVLVEMYSGKADFFADASAATTLTPSAEGSGGGAGSLPLGEAGRAPLFRAESAFEHLAMVERTLGALPPRLYGLWANVDAPASIGAAAKRRVEGAAPTLAEAMTRNRAALALDWASRTAIASARLRDARAVLGPAQSGFGLALDALLGAPQRSALEPWELERLATPEAKQAAAVEAAAGDAAAAARRALADVEAEKASCAVEGWRADAALDLARRLLDPEAAKRPTARESLGHVALRTGFMATLGGKSLLEASADGLQGAAGEASAGGSEQASSFSSFFGL